VSHHITLQDVANEVGFSRGYVSRALRSRPEVPPETQAKVVAAATKLGYRPNLVAKSLRSKKTKTIGAIIADIDNTFYAAIVNGIEDTAREKGYSIILSNTDEDPARERAAVDLLGDKRVDGLLITPVRKQTVELLRKKRPGIPFVVVARYFDKSIFQINYVGVDEVLGGFLATEYLIKKGHRRILYVNAPSRFLNARERLAGYKKALLQHQLEFDENLIITLPNQTMEEAYELTKKALSKKLDFTAVFAYCDFFALGAMRALYERGFRIPEDIAVVGYDDIEFVSYLQVPLTTVHTPKYRLGKEAIELLVRIISEKSPKKSEQIIIKPMLAIRKSV